MTEIRENVLTDFGWAWLVLSEKPTGRWKCVTTNGDSAIYVEVKGLFLRRWIHEESLSISVIEGHVNECSQVAG